MQDAISFVDDLQKFKMADESNTDYVAFCLNSLTLLNMHNIASKDVLCELVNDYFVTCPIVNGDDDSDLSETETELSGDEVEPEGIGTPGGDTVGGSVTVVTDDDVSDDDQAVFAGAIEHLADVIMPRGNGDVVETEPQFQLNCSCKLYNGQPCHGRYVIEELADICLQFLGMTHDELDIAILAKLSCGMHLSKMTTGSCRRQQKVRKIQVDSTDTSLQDCWCRGTCSSQQMEDACVCSEV